MCISLGDSEVCIILLFLLTLFICFLLLVYRSCKGIKDRRKKKKIPLKSVFIFEVHDYFVMK